LRVHRWLAEGLTVDDVAPGMPCAWCDRGPRAHPGTVLEVVRNAAGEVTEIKARHEPSGSTRRFSLWDADDIGALDVFMVCGRFTVFVGRHLDAAETQAFSQLFAGWWETVVYSRMTRQAFTRPW
jgi:hypothetical protein